MYVLPALGLGLGLELGLELGLGLGFGLQQRGRVASDGAKGRAKGAKGRPRQAPPAQGKHVMS